MLESLQPRSESLEASVLLMCLKFDVDERATYLHGFLILSQLDSFAASQKSVGKGSVSLNWKSRNPGKGSLGKARGGALVVLLKHPGSAGSVLCSWAGPRRVSAGLSGWFWSE